MNQEASKSILAQNLRLLMERHGWKQTELAKRSGVSQAAISAILRGQKAATIDTIDAFSRAFSLNSWQLLLPQLGMEPAIADSITLVLTRFIQSSEQGRDMISRIAQREAEPRP